MSNDKKNEAPAGFDISVGRTQADGWAKKVKDNTIHGRLLGRYTMGEDRAYYQVELLADCDAVEGKGEEVKDVKLKKGQIVNFDESKAFSDLKPYAADGGIYDVWFKYEDKIKLDNGNTFWPIVGPKLKQVKAPPKDNIPF